MPSWVPGTLVGVAGILLAVLQFIVGRHDRGEDRAHQRHTEEQADLMALRERLKETETQLERERHDWTVERATWTVKERTYLETIGQQAIDLGQLRTLFGKDVKP